MNRTVSAWFFLGVGALLFFVLLLIAKSFVLAIIVGGMMALILHPFNRYLCNRMKAYQAALISTLTLACLVLVPVVLLIIVSLRDATTLTHLLMSGDTTSQLQIWWADSVEKLASLLPIAEKNDINELALKLGRYSLDISSGVVFRFASDLPALLLQITLGALSCYFFLLDGRRFAGFVKSLIPFPESIQREIEVSFKDATRTTLLASLAAAVTQAVIVAATFFIVGIPSIALASGVTFIFAWIPVLGSLPVFLAAGIWLASLGLWVKVLVLVVMAVVTGISDNIVRPFVLKGGNDMHPLISLVAILGGIEFFGLMGVVIGPVLVSIFLTFAKLWPKIAKDAGWQV